MAKNCEVTWVLFAAALMGLILAASVVGVQGKEAPGGAGTITVGNGIYDVSVQDAASSTGIGTYTVSTGPVFPQPDENVLFGGADRDPWSSYLTVRSYNTSTDYVTANDSGVNSPFTVRMLDPALASINSTNTSVTATWNTATAPNMSDALLITQVTAVEGMNLFNSRVRVTTNVTNVGSANVSIGIRYEWDLMIDGNDGSWLAERGPDGGWLDTETEWLAPSFESFETTNDPTNPFFSIFGTVTGNETFSPQPTPPDLLQFAYWGRPGAFSAAFDYTPAGQIVAGADNDSAVTYLWGHNGTTAIVLGPTETVSVTQYQYVVVNVTRVCEDSVKSFEDEFGLSICVYTYPSGDQSMVITDGTKTVEIQVLGHNFTCDEVVDLLEGLDLANFATLPDVMVIDYSESVDFQLWRSRADYLAERDPTLYVENLQLITGTGSFERPDLNLSCEGEDDDECNDERVIVGVALLTSMVQGYEGEPLGFDTISIYVGESIEVEYLTGEDPKLTVEFSSNLVEDLENVGAVDLVAGFGDALDWMSDASPEYSFISCYVELVGYDGKYDLVVEYYLDENQPEPNLTVRFDPPSPQDKGAVLAGTGSSLGWGSAPDYDRIECYDNKTGDKTELIVEYYLPGNESPSLTLVLDPPSPRYVAAVTAGAGSIFGPGSPWKYERMVSYENITDNKTTLFVLYYLNETDEDPALTLELDPPSPPNTAAVTAGSGSSLGWGSAPHYEKILSYQNVTGNKTTLIVAYYLNESDTDPSLLLEFDPPSPPNTAAVTSGAGSTWGWGSPPHYDRMESYELWNGDKYDLIVEYYLNENDTVPSLTLVIDPLDPLEIANLVASAGSSETWIPVPPYDGIKCYESGGCIIVELYKNGVKIAEQSFCGLTGSDLIEQLIDFLTSSLFGVQAPALNLVGLLSLIGFLSMTAGRRLKGRRD
jgi:hypothetical protein